MELFAIALPILVLFVSFGFMVGVLFGFFGMGGSFLVMPALLVMGYPARVAVGSGMAFVFGTAVIVTMKHHDLGQVDYKLGGLMIVGTTAGIEVGRISVFYLEDLGLASGIIGITYVFLLGTIGLFVTFTALRGDGKSVVGRDHVRTDGDEGVFDGDEGGSGHHDPDTEIDVDDIPDVAKRIQSYRVPPMLTIAGGIQVSL